MKNKQTLIGSALLVLTAFIWGTAFVAQSAGMDYLEPFSFNGIRCLFASIALGIFIIIYGLIKKQKRTNSIKTLLIGGSIIGVVLFVASSTQQIGIKMIGAGKSGFITSLYIVFVSVIGLLFKKKVNYLGWISVGIAVVGSFFLCMDENFTLGIGEMFSVIGAVFFALQILLIDYFAPKTSPIGLSCIQLLVVFILSIVPMFVFEAPTWDGIHGALPSLLYAGVLSGGIAYTLQITAQRKVPPLVASLIMGLESLFAGIAGAVILHEVFTWRDFLGSALILSAVVLSQIPIKSKNKTNSERINYERT